MRQSIRLGTVHGIPIGAHWSAVVILVLLIEGLAAGALPAAAAGYAAAAYWLAAAGLAALFLASLLAHEYAHARTAQHYGIRVRSITLWMLGGVSELDREPPRPAADLLIAVAGPATSLAAAGTFLLAALGAGRTGALLPQVGFTWLALANAAIGVFNLLPGTPLDGGRVLGAVLWRLRGDRAWARQAAARSGIVIGLVLSTAGIVLVVAARSLGGLWLMLLGWYLSSAARTEAATVRLNSGLGDVPVGRLMSAPAVCGYTGQTVAAFVAGIAAAHPHRCYPVVDLDGRFAGVVTTATLARVPAQGRAEVRLGQALIGPAQVPVADPRTTMRDPAAFPTGPLQITVIVEGGRPCGVLTAGDVQRALAVAALGEAPDRSAPARWQP